MEAVRRSCGAGGPAGRGGLREGGPAGKGGGCRAWPTSLAHKSGPSPGDLVLLANTVLLTSTGLISKPHFTAMFSGKHLDNRRGFAMHPHRQNRPFVALFDHERSIFIASAVKALIRGSRDIWGVVTSHIDAINSGTGSKHRTNPG